MWKVLFADFPVAIIQYFSIYQRHVLTALSVHWILVAGVGLLASLPEPRCSDPRKIKSVRFSVILPTNIWVCGAGGVGYVLERCFYYYFCAPLPPNHVDTKVQCLSVYIDTAVARLLWLWASVMDSLDGGDHNPERG